MIATRAFESKAAFAAGKLPSASVNRRDVTLVLAYTTLKSFGLSSTNLLTSFDRAACAPSRRVMRQVIGIVDGNVVLGDNLSDSIRDLSRQYIRHHAVGLPQLVIGGGSPFDIVFRPVETPLSADKTITAEAVVSFNFRPLLVE